MMVDSLCSWLDVNSCLAEPPCPLLPRRRKPRARGRAAPNILLIVADGIGSWMLGCNGNTQIHTPNIDLLAKGGTRFAGNFVCAPSPRPAARHYSPDVREAAPPMPAPCFSICWPRKATTVDTRASGTWEVTPRRSITAAYWQPSTGLPDPITAQRQGISGSAERGQAIFPHDRLRYCSRWSGLPLLRDVREIHVRGHGPRSRVRQMRLATRIS